MLDKLVVHLKNIIFFKAVLYIIITIILFTMIPVFSGDLQDTSIKYKKSYSLLQTAKTKLKSILNFEDTIFNTKDKYKELISQSKNHDCLNRTTLIKQINTLNKKHSLFEPIFVRISRQFDDEITSASNSNVKVNHYEIEISFRATDRGKMLMVCNDLYDILPKGSLVTNTSIKSVEALTPEIISRLNTKNEPGLLEIDMNIQLSEIVYEE
jgi:hypothetical protein